ncbi:MAG TPA: ATP-grasp domain-containing protein [Candidatus Polarisedimenticolaceae bacterium]|nr:ATP-grasp domain-containing protein [Candidatus Polarisedimenticolaceae bacterium]
MEAAPLPVVFVAPFFAPTTLRFIDACAGLEGARVALISQDPVERLPHGLRGKLAAHWGVRDGLDAAQLTEAVRQLSGRIGKPRRLIGALEQLQVPLAEVREALGIDGMRVEAAHNFRDKSRMKDVLRRAGVPCARHRLVRSAEEALAFAAEIGFPLVAKPPAGAAARGTHRLEDSADLRGLLALSPPQPAAPLLLEEFIVGDEHSFDAVTIDGRPVWHSLTHYTPGPLEVLRHPWIQWTVLLPREVDHPRYDDIRRVAARALEALGMGTGLSHMEWFRRQDGSVAVSEVGARPPGAQFTTLISYAHDVDFYRAWARLVVFDSFAPPPRRYAAGIAYLRGQGQGRVRAIHGLDRAQRELGELVVEVQLPQPGQLPASSYEGEGYVVLRHPDTGVVARGLAQLVQLVQIELG